MRTLLFTSAVAIATFATPAHSIGRCDRLTRDNCVVDGDTIRWQGERVRLADINAPELHGPACPAELALAERARDRLVALLNRRAFALTANDDGTGRSRDRYGRILAVVRQDGRSVGQVLVSEGLAKPWRGRREPWCPVS